MKRVALLAAVAILAGCGPINQFSKPDPSAGRLLDQSTEADRFMVLNCVYNGWRNLAPNVESDGTVRPGADRVRVYRGVDANGQSIFNPYVDIMQGGYGARVQYHEAPGSNLPRDFENVVKQCLVPYSGGTD